MSPHIAINERLDELEHQPDPVMNEVLVERQIVLAFTSSLITAEEFHHYCKRLRDVCLRTGRMAA